MTLLLKSNVLQLGKWKSHFLLVLYSYMSEFLLKYIFLNGDQQLKEPPINPNPCSYLRVLWIHILP